MAVKFWPGCRHGSCGERPPRVALPDSRHLQKTGPLRGAREGHAGKFRIVYLRFASRLLGGSRSTKAAHLKQVTSKVGMRLTASKSNGTRWHP
jgi:hypothetical protein